MALVLKDRVQEVTNTTGTGTLTLAGAVTGFQTFAAVGDGNTTYYAITGGSEWELGIGTYTASGTTLSRDTVLSSSNSGNLVDFAAGSKTVFVTYPTSRVVIADGTSIAAANSSILPVASGGTGSATATFSGANITSLNASAISTGTIANARTTASSANGASTIVSRGASGEFAAGVIEFAAGTASAPSITTTGDTNTGIFFPAADTIAFTEGGAEAARFDSSGRLLIGTTSGTRKLTVYENAAQVDISIVSSTTGLAILQMGDTAADNQGQIIYRNNGDSMEFAVNGAERMRIDSSGNVLVGTTTAYYSSSGRGLVEINGSSNAMLGLIVGGTGKGFLYHTGTDMWLKNGANGTLTFYTNDAERARITSGGDFLVGTTNASPAGFNVDGVALKTGNPCDMSRMGGPVFRVNRGTDDGELVQFLQDGTQEGNISVSGSTVSYNGFSGGHWSQLQEGRGYNPEILRGTVMSTIGDMCEWKSVVWDEVIEHPAVPAVEAKEAVLDEEGNVIEPAVEAVEGKDAWTETILHREAYLGNLAVGATFEEDGFTKTVVDDGNERLPKVKISDVVGDKAVYGVFQTWDEVQDMLVTSLGAFVVRIASGVTVQIGDLLESNGDGCAKVQDDDVIRSKTIAKVTSTTPTATYADGSYTVPAVIYCG
jgi:hypothetical protein